MDASLASERFVSERTTLREGYANAKRPFGSGIGRGEASREDRDGSDGEEIGIVGALKS